MNRATKGLLAFGGIVVLAYPGVAWVTGMAVESRIQRNEQQALDRVPYLTLLKREYHRGVYRSTEIATYGLRIPLPPAAGTAAAGALAAATTLTVTSNIQHGPFPGMRSVGLATTDSTVSAPPAWRQALAGGLGSQPILRVHATIGLFGGAMAELTSPAFSARLPGGAALTWGGLTGSLAATGNGGHASGRMLAPRLALQAAQGTLEVAGIGYAGSYEKALDQLYTGTATFTIAHIDGRGPRGDYSLRNFSFKSTAGSTGGFFDLRADLAVAGASFAGVRLRRMTYSESLEHVDGASLDSLTRAIRGAQRRAVSDPTQLQAGIQDALRRYGVDLLLHDPLLDIRQVGFTTAEGSLLLSARISAPGLSRADLQWPAAIAALKEHARISADLRVDEGLAQKLLSLGGPDPKRAAQLTSFEQQGYLTAASGALTTHVAYGGGHLTLNGHRFPPLPPAS